MGSEPIAAVYDGKAMLEVVARLTAMLNGCPYEPNPEIPAYWVAEAALIVAVITLTGRDDSGEFLRRLAADTSALMTARGGG
jgi:hypothetical protein